MAFAFKLPDIGEGVVEGELTKWLVQEGQQVSEDTPLVEILTDKVAAIIPSPRRGTIVKLHFGEGDMVPVGAVLVTIEEAGAAVAAAPPVPAAAPAAHRVAAPAPVAAAVDAAVDAAGRVRAAPATRKLARTLGIDLTAVTATGEEGRVTRADVQAAASSPKAAAAPAAVSAPASKPLPAGPDEERVKVRGLRRKIFAKMREAKDHAAHFTYVEEIDFTEIVAMQAGLAQAGLKTTFLPFVMKAVVLSLQKPAFRSLNAHMDDAAGELVLCNRYHIGVAAATDAGLTVPVVRDVDQKSIRQLTEAVAHLGEGARTGTLTAPEMSGSTFTITSLGKLGGMFATPIVNYPEVAILGLHKVEKRPVVIGDQIVIRERMYMSCSFDHRLIDGHVGAAFVQSIKTLLESPALLLAELA